MSLRHIPKQISSKPKSRGFSATESDEITTTCSYVGQCPTQPHLLGGDGPVHDAIDALDVAMMYFCGEFPPSWQCAPVYFASLLTARMKLGRHVFGGAIER